MIRIRPEEPLDREAALEVERLAFGSDEEPGIVEAVRGDDGSFALVAEEEGAIVGQRSSASRVDRRDRGPAFCPRFGFVPGSAFGLANPFAGVRPDGFEIGEEDFMVAVVGEADLTVGSMASGLRRAG